MNRLLTPEPSPRTVPLSACVPSSGAVPSRLTFCFHSLNLHSICTAVHSSLSPPPLCGNHSNRSTLVMKRKKTERKKRERKKTRLRCCLRGEECRTTNAKEPVYHRRAPLFVSDVCVCTSWHERSVPTRFSSFCARRARRGRRRMHVLVCRMSTRDSFIPEVLLIPLRDLGHRY